jgi:hypothetical protein
MKIFETIYVVNELLRVLVATLSSLVGIKTQEKSGHIRLHMNTIRA